MINGFWLGILQGIKPWHFQTHFWVMVYFYLKNVTISELCLHTEESYLESTRIHNWAARF